MKTVFLHESFKSAGENMRYDEYLIDQCLLKKNTRFIRLYEWNTPGITFPKHKQLSANLRVLDHAPRVSGGGVVFHGKGDFVFSVVSSLDDDLFPRHFKQKIDWISSFFSQCLIENNIQVVKDSNEATLRDTNYCITYSNPYEFYYQGQKVLGLAQRKYKNVFCSQGIIYCQSNFEQFPHINEELLPYLTEGLKGVISAKKVIDTALILGKRCFGS
jgi:lipoate-protein ligase A